MWENITMMSSTPTEQMSPTLNTITIDMAKAQPSNNFVANFFHFNTIESKGLINVN